MTHDADCACVTCCPRDVNRERAVGEQIRMLSEAMRAVGAGRATLDGLSLDLTEAPLPPPAPPREAQKTLSDEASKARDESILFGAGAGKRLVLR